MQSVRASTLIPWGFVADDAVNNLDGTLIAMRPAGVTSQCPACRTISGRIHSRYSRRLADLPIAGRRVRLVLLARRFHCDAVLCERRIFTERFGADVLAPWARRTARLDHIVHHLALALGGRPAASFARRLMLPVSNDTLLRLVRAGGALSPSRPRQSSGSTTGLGDATIATGRSSAISSVARRSHCSRIANQRRLRPGSPASHRSASWRAIAAAVRLWPQRKRSRRRFRSRIVGI